MAVRRWTRILLLAAGALALASPAAFAQQTTSGIRGKVLDEAGQPVGGVTVSVRDTRTGATRSLSSNATGTFQATNLPVGGPYEVVVNGELKLLVPSIELGDVYKLDITLPSAADLEEVVVVGERSGLVDIAAGPAATFSELELKRAVAFDRDIKDVYSIDPRLNIDNPQEGAAVNCVGKHPRFNSITLDGVSQNDRFGLNANGYATATGMPFPYAAIKQVAVELAPFDVSYGGFSACNINAVTKSGGNEFHGGAFYEYTDQSLRGDSLTVDGDEIKFDTPDYDETIWGSTSVAPSSRIGCSCSWPMRNPRKPSSSARAMPAPAMACSATGSARPTSTASSPSRATSTATIREANRATARRPRKRRWFAWTGTSTTSTCCP